MPVGFKNFGSTCWINSNLQCILHQTKFQKWLKNIAEKIESNPEEKLKLQSKKKNNILEALIHIFYGSGLISNSIEPNNQRLLLGIQVILHDIFKLKPEFLKNPQQDSHESILFLLDMIHQNIYHDLSFLKNQNQTLSLSDQEWLQYHQYQNSEIYDMFFGQTKQIINNLNTNETNIRYEPFLSLFVNLPEIPNDCQTPFCFKVEDSLNIWNKKHKMDPNLEIYVENSFHKLPEILLISFLSNSHLNPPYLFIPSETISIPFSNQENQENQEIKYELTSLLFHLGNQAGGHYLCACKENEKWFSINDEIVQQLPDNAINKPTNYLPVVLFYQKI